jgi:hypothetical protein
VKHVFIIHSHLAIGVCNGIIRSENIDHGSIIYLLMPRFQEELDFNIKSYCVPKHLGQSKITSLYNIFDIVSYVFELDSWISKNIGTNYSAYIPHEKNYFFKGLVSNKNCIDRFYFEEGRLSFLEDIFNNHRTSFRCLLKRHIWPFNRVFSPAYFLNKAKGYYAVNKKTFKTGVLNKIITPVFHNSNFKLPTHELILVIILEKTTSWPSALIIAYISSILEVIQSGKYSLIYYKLHPDQLPLVESEIYRNLLKGNKCREIPSNVSIEGLAFEYNKLEFLLFNTSAKLYFPKETKTIDLYDILLKENSNLEKMIKDVKGVQFKIVKS